MAFGRGENIGEAFVRIVYSGDGANLSKKIRDDMERESPAFEAMGEKHSQAYEKGFNKEIKKDKKVTFESLEKALDKGLGRMEATGGKASSALMDGLDADLRSRFGDDIANAMSESLRDRLKRGGSFTEVQKILSSDLERLVESATNTVRAGEQATLKEQAAFEKKFTDAMNRDVKKQMAFERDFRSSLGKISVDAERAWTGGEKAVEDYRSSLDRLTITNAKVGVGFGKLVHQQDEETKKTKEQSGWLHKVNKELDGFAEKVGAGFGRGSRNNFLNFIGSMVKNSLDLVGLLPKMGEQVAGFFSKFDQVRKAEGLLAAISPAALTALGGLTALAIGGTALILVIGPLVALLSGLLGILVALASTVFMAAVAGAAALAGALVPLGVGLVATIGAIASQDWKKGPMHQGLLDLKKEVKGLGEEVAKPLFANFGGVIDRVGGVLKELNPLAHAAGVGLRGMFDSILHGMQSNGFKQFIGQFSNVLPGMLRKLGQIFSNTFGGLAGLFRGMIPLVQKFLGWLEKITGQFQEWANSRQGQKDIKQFLSDAADSAKSLGDFLGQAGGLLMDLINNGKNAGDNMFDGMTRAIEKFRKFLKEPVTAPQVGMAGRKDPLGELPKPDPGGSLNRLDEWFGFAQKLADALGAAVVNAGKLMGKLSDKDAQDNLLTMLDIMNKIIGLLNTMDALWNAGIINPLGTAITKVRELVNWIKRIHFAPIKGFSIGDIIKPPNLTKIAAGFAGLAGKVLKQIGTVNVSGIIRGASTALGRLLGTFAGAAGKVLSRIDPVNVAGIITGAATALSRLLGTFTGAAKKIFDKIFPVNVSGIITGAGEAVANLIAHFAGVAQTISSMLSGIHVSINWPSPPGWLSKLTASGGVFAGAQTRIIGEAGPEAVVPLNRPLNMVDPAVRWLSAIAQGKEMPPMGAGGVGGVPSRTVNVGGITVISPQADPHAVAVEAINHLVAVGY